MVSVSLYDPKPSGVKTAKYSWGEHHFFCDRSTTPLQAWCEVSQVCGGSSPIPVDYTTTTMPALVTLNVNKQALNKVISRSQKIKTQRKVSQSVLRVFGIISVDFLWVQKQLNPALSTNLRQREIIFSWTVEKHPSMHFLRPLNLFGAPGRWVSRSQNALGKNQGNTSGQVRA